MIIDKYDEKMAQLKKKKEDELRKINERTMKLKLKKSEKIMSALEDACGELTEEKIELIVEYIRSQSISIKMNVCPEPETVSGHTKTKKALLRVFSKRLYLYL